MLDEMPQRIEVELLLALSVSYRNANLDITRFFNGGNDLGLIG